MNTSARAKLTLADSAENRFIDFVKPGIGLADVTDSSYWRDVVGSLQLNDVVSCVATNGSFEADLRLIEKLPSGSVKWRVIREWKPAAEEVQDKHAIVCRNPEKGTTDWVLAVGSGAGTWRYPFPAVKRTCLREAIEMLISRDVSMNLTIYPGAPQDVLANPDATPSGFSITVICPESSGDKSRWTILNNVDGSNYRIGQVVAGGGIVQLLRGIAADGEDSPFDTSIVQVRPDLTANDLLAPPAKLRND